MSDGRMGMVGGGGARALVMAVVLSVGGGVTGATDAEASPFHGCTFLKPRLAVPSWPGGLGTGCANFAVQTLSCTKYVPTPLGVVSYPGDLVSGRLPAYFVEVTPYRGWSVFAEDPIDGWALRQHLVWSEQYWEAVMNARYPLIAAAIQAVPFHGDGQHESMPGDNGGLLYARTLKVPYGAWAWSFPTIGITQGSAAPMCFDGISEMTPEVWADLPGHGETAMALAHALVTGPLCNQPFSGVYTPEMPVGSPLDDVRQACAFPTNTVLVAGGVWEPTSEASEVVLSPRKVCAGRLGPHLPRTGRVHTPNEWEAANLVAYRMATLAEDHWMTGPGMEPGDRWQLVWPPMASPGAHQCFRPGALQAEELATGGPIAIPPLPGTDGPIRPGGTLATFAKGGGSYVWAVWRQFTRCVEPGQGALFGAELAVHHPAAVAACSVANATDGMP